jgi:hypothetical protein
MELAIPLIALGSLYVTTNYDQNNRDRGTPPSSPTVESFTNMGKPSNYLPNTNIPPTNYPVSNQAELNDTVQEYPNPNVATDKYFDQNAYEKAQRSGQNVGNNPQQIYSLTGEYIDSNQFKHANMVPFNGKKPRGQIYNNNNAETILDSYSGSGSQVIKKIEQAPLFKPEDNIGWTYGAPNNSDFYLSRQTPSLRNNMVKPFESERVGPALNKGFGTEGSGGFNSGMEARDSYLPKTVNEMRVLTNPKEEYTLDGLEGPGLAAIKNTGTIGKVEKYAPDTFFVNSQDRWLTTTGAEKGYRPVAKEIVKPSHRNDTTQYVVGPSSAALKTSSYVPAKHTPSDRPELPALDVSHSSAVGTGPITDGERAINSHTKYENNRSTTSAPQTFGTGFSRAMGAAVAPIMDLLRPSRKEEFGCNIRGGGNVGSSVPDSYVTNPDDKLAPTIKETTLHKTVGYMGHQQQGGGYESARYQTLPNQRDTTNCSVYGVGSASNQGVRQYDAEYRTNSNGIKETTLIGRTNQGNASMLNTNVNVSTSKRDCDRENNRMWAPSAVIPSGPSAQTFGKLDVPHRNDGELCDTRLDPKLLKAFKENPYTQFA